MLQFPPSSEFQKVHHLLNAMTLDEKIALMAGVDDWHVAGVPRLGVQGMKVTDCGHGVTLVGEDVSPATCLPTGIGMASTWNEALMEEAGALLGRECRALNCSLLLGPKINLHRHPLNGRSFETFSEDPLLAGVLGAAIIRGIQSQGVGACVKAMAANNQQHDQQSVSSEVSERALRELYYRAFEIAVDQGRPAAIMTSYNRLNGEYTAESRKLITDLIKDEWRFPGFVVSDWRSIRTERVYESGLDLEMPGPGKFFNRAAVLRALDEGLLTLEDIDDKAGRILRALLHWAQPTANKGELDSPRHRETALRVAEESIVLLKNEGDLLPLDTARLKRILVTGPNALDARLGGGGSASVTPFYSVGPLEAIRRICGSDVQVDYVEGCSLVGSMQTMEGCFRHRVEGAQTAPGLRADYFNKPTPSGKPVASTMTDRLDFSWGWASPGPSVARGTFSVRFSGEFTPPETGLYKLGVYAQEGCALLMIGGKVVLDAWARPGEGNFEETYRTVYETIELNFEAGVPVPIVLEYGKRAARAAVRMEWHVPGAQDQIMAAAEAAEGADAVIICAGLSNLLEGGGCDRAHIDLPETQQDLIRTLARVNPWTIVVLNNGGPLSVPWADEVPALIEAWYPGQEGGNALARILFGLANPSGRLPDTIPFRLEDHAAAKNYPGDGNVVRYEEDIYVGYRHFDSRGIEPRFPFGFGLSYTSFEIGAPELGANRQSVSVRVTNTGNRVGQEVVQMYVRAVDSPVERPWQELRAFCKIALAPGESREVVFPLTPADFACFDPDLEAWHNYPGRYEIRVGRHSRDLRGLECQGLLSLSPK